MLSRRNAWLLLAVPVGVLLLWLLFGRQEGQPEEEVSDQGLSGQLLYLTTQGEGAVLRAYDPKSGETQALTQDLQISSFHPAPDGLFIYFAAANGDLGADIWRLSVADLSTELLIACGQENCDGPQASPDGRYLAYTRLEAATGLPQIWLYELGSGAGEALSTSGQIVRNLIWSPDGRLAYYNQTLAGYEIVGVESGERKLETNALGEGLTWLADSSAFIAAEAFRADSAILRGPTGEASLQTPEPGSQTALEITVSALLQYAEGGPVSLLDYGSEQIEDAAPSASPNGRWLAFTRKYLDEERWTPGRQLWIYDFEDGRAVPLTESPSHQMSAIAWSADSSLLAFVRSNRTDFNQPTEIWIMRPDGSEAQLIAVEAFAPQWMP